jgi:septal ring factor EnvC (AmiA/AmiB activator)
VPNLAPERSGLPPLARSGIAVLSATVVLTLVVGGSAAASPSSEGRLERAEARVERLSAELTGSRQRFDRLGRRAESARLAESRIARRLAEGERRLERIEERITQARDLAAEAGRRLGIARQKLGQRLVAIYQAGTTDAIAVLLATEDFGALASAGAYLQAIADSERDLAARVAGLRAQRVAALSDVEAARTELAAEVVGLRSARRSVAEARVSAEASASRLASVQQERRARIEELRSEVDRIESAAAGAEGSPNFAGGPYAIPTYIVMCESGGNYSALNPSSGAGGAYQIIPSTWEAYGGQGLPHLASKAEQDRIARLIWESDGPGAWVCA